MLRFPRSFCAASVLLSAVFSALSAARLEPSPFGTLLGVTDGPVEVYSCNLEPDRKALDMEPNYINGTYTGVKWQCVELARRYLLINFGVVFDSVEYAYQIFDFTSVGKVSDKSRVAFNKHANGGPIPPEHGSLLIWKPYGEMAVTGHVAVVIDVTDTYVDIAEQNVEDTIWPENRHYSRRLDVKKNSTSFHIEKWFEEEDLVGWMTVDLKTPLTLNSATTDSNSLPILELL
mmetsp:Transcript_113972/g.362418  ORF Transcript_113972/g.362418 Transcript_113972/m.362418 type:complete len:232 (+) Transcript_113972:1135-1830(+)